MDEINEEEAPIPQTLEEAIIEADNEYCAHLEKVKEFYIANC